MLIKEFNVLITRPKHQAQGLYQAIIAAGGRAFLCPTIEIIPPAHPDALAHAIQQLGEADLALFISPNAVLQSRVLLQKYWPQTPTRLKIAAIGTGTAKALASIGWSVHLVPQQFNSEGLLALPELQDLHEKIVMLFKGEGGRELLASTLKQRGARVIEALAYRRQLPKIETTLVADWQNHAINLIISTSVDSLRNLFTMVGEAGKSWLQQTTFIVISERMRVIAHDFGIQKVLLAADASDEAIMKTIVKEQQHHAKAR